MEVPHRTSLAPLALPLFFLCLTGVKTEGLLDYQESAGIISIAPWNLRPAIFGVDVLSVVRSVRFGHGTVPAVPVFDSPKSSEKGKWVSEQGP